jgi:hypothetical protein
VKVRYLNRFLIPYTEIDLGYGFWGLGNEGGGSEWHFGHAHHRMAVGARIGFEVLTSDLLGLGLSMDYLVQNLLNGVRFQRKNGSSPVERTERTVHALGLGLNAHFHF